MRHLCNKRIKGFTLVEAMIAIVVLGIAASGILLPYASGAITNAAAGTVFVNITSVPSITSIRFWSAPGNAVDWSPVGGAFFRSVTRR